MNFNPYEKVGRGGGASFSHAEGGGGGSNMSWGSFYVIA